VSSENVTEKLRSSLLLPTIGLGASVVYFLSIGGILSLLTELFGPLAPSVSISLSSMLPLLLCALSMWLTTRARTTAATHIASTDFEEYNLARITSKYSKLINIIAIAAAGVIGLVSGIAAAAASVEGSIIDLTSQLIFTICFVLGLAAIYFGIRIASQLKSSESSTSPVASAPLAAVTSNPAGNRGNSSAINALIIPVFALVVVPVFATLILTSTKGVGGEWVIYGGIVAVAAALFVGARLLAKSSPARDEAGKLVGGTVTARQWIFYLNFVFLFFAIQILWGTSIAQSLSDGLGFGDEQRSIADLLIDLAMPIAVLTIMFAAHHFVLIFRAQTPDK
jgi:hypothetical protein